MREKKRKVKPHYGRIIAALAVFALLTMGIVWFFSYGTKMVATYRVYNGDAVFIPPSEEDYPVRGVDVSKWQGEIDWQAIEAAGMSFAFIKSTEGQDYVDPYYKENIKKASETNMYFGAYHYFSFGTDGLEQAKNFTRTVSPEDCFLPPVVDFELTDEDDSKKSYTLHQLEELLENLEAYYGVTPIIYTTPTAYFKYLAFGTKWKRYTMWMRNTYGEPFTKWSFWQYSDKGLIDGSYNGDEKYIDLNVYNGSMDDFIKEFSKQDS